MVYIQLPAPAHTPHTLTQNHNQQNLQSFKETSQTLPYSRSTSPPPIVGEADTTYPVSSWEGHIFPVQYSAPNG